MLRSRQFPVMLVLAGFAAAMFSPAVRAEEPTEKQLKVGMVKGMFRDVPPALLTVLSKPFRELMLRQTGYAGDVEVLPDAYVLADAMKQKQCDLGVFYGFEYAWVKRQHPDLIPLVVTVPPGRKTQACVVVHKDHPAKTLADIDTECVVFPRGTKSHCLAFLDKLRAGMPATIAVPKPLVTKTAEDLLNTVVTCECCAALVDSASLAGYEVLHPGAFKHLRVLAQSEEFPATVIAYRKGTLSTDTAAKVKDGLLAAHRSPAGRPLMMLWNLKGFDAVPTDYEAQLEEILKAYPPVKQIESK